MEAKRPLKVEEKKDERKKKKNIEESTEELKGRREKGFHQDRHKRLEELIDRRDPKVEEGSVYIWNLSKDCMLRELLEKLESFGEIQTCHVIGPRTEDERVFPNK